MRASEADVRGMTCVMTKTCEALTKTCEASIKTCEASTKTCEADGKHASQTFMEELR